MKKVWISIVVLVMVFAICVTCTACDLFGGKGENGVGIESIEKTGTKGLVDTYTITMTDGTTSTFTVTNGKNGSSSSSTSMDEFLRFELLEDGTYEVSELHYYIPFRIEIPETYNGKTVSAIAEDAFDNNPFLEEIVIPKTVVKIGSGFANDRRLKKIYFQGDLKDWCALEGAGNLTDINKEAIIYVGGAEVKGNIVIPTGVTIIKKESFSGFKDITSVVIPNGVTIIEERAFYSIGIRSITIPTTLTKIDSYAFGSCTNLTSINYQGTKEQWYAIKKSTESTISSTYSNWDKDAGNYTVHCTDGDIKKSNATFR